MAVFTSTILDSPPQKVAREKKYHSSAYSLMHLPILLPTGQGRGVQGNTACLSDGWRGRTLALQKRDSAQLMDPGDDSAILSLTTCLACHLPVDASLRGSVTSPAVATYSCDALGASLDGG